MRTFRAVNASTERVGWFTFYKRNKHFGMFECDRGSNLIGTTYTGHSVKDVSRISGNMGIIRRFLYRILW